jgi:hypothetical protein
LITVYDDAPEENNEYAEPQTCEGDGIRLYFRAVGEPWFESRLKEEKGLPWKTILNFWSKWRDSNSRPPVPEAIGSSLLTTLVCFLVLLSPKTVLSGTLVHTVSAQSKSVDGQRCGHRANLTKLKARKLNRIYPLLSFFFCH